MIEIEYQLREQDLIAFNEHQLQNTESVQKHLRRHQATFPTVLSAIAMLVLFYLKDIPAGVLVGVVAVAWGLGVPLFIKRGWRKQIGKMYTDEDKAKLLGNYTLRIHPKDLVEIGPTGESRISWKDVLRVEGDKKYAFVFVTLESALIIPRATVRKGDMHEFVKQVDQYISDAE
jgi:hypothetical protein